MNVAVTADDPRPGLRLRHATPGRLRLSSQALYRLPGHRVRALEARLRLLDGVRDVHIQPLTGSLLVQHAPAQSPDTLLPAIAEALGVVPAPAGAPSPPPAPAVSLPALSELAGLLRGGQVPAAPRRTTPTVFWHALSPEEVLARLEVDDAAAGLDPAEARARRQHFGPNHLPEAAQRSELSMLLEQVLTLPVGLLGVSAAVSIATGGVLDAAVIAAVVAINSTIGFVTERQAERTIRGLGELRPHHTQVLRGGHRQAVAAEELVPGDLVLLEPGSYVPADLRLLHCHRLSIDESALTGESQPVSKHAEATLPADTALAERHNLALLGTIVTGGNGLGVVVASGADTELGHIQTLAGEVRPPETPIEQQLGRMGSQLAILSSAVCAGVFGMGLLRGQGFIEMLKSSVSLAVAAVPEGLPAVATSTLSLGIQEMRRRHVAIRHLGAVETLGSVQTFCLDKTGTLTRNRMQVSALTIGGESVPLHDGVPEPLPALQQAPGQRLLQVLALCNEVQDGADGSPEGSATELALLSLVQAAGLDSATVRADHPLLVSRPRAEGRPLMSTLHAWPGGGGLLAVKGSPADVLARCDYWLEEGQPLGEAEREQVLRQNEHMAAQALRVLGVAYRVLANHDYGRTEQLVWLGLVGMRDPLRPGMQALIARFHDAGIKTVMITGDQSATARAIAEELALAGGQPLRILDAASLETMDAEVLRGLAPDIDVFARVSPAHKLRIVQAYQAAGQVVAMTGDGINDAPALKAADVGVAMGRSGTDVARSVADVVLEDDELHTMLAAIEQGRTIYGNIRKTIHFLLSTNFTEIELMFAGLATGLGQTLNPMQLLWINLVSDIFPGLALSLEPAEKDILQRPPRDPDESIITRRELGWMGRESLVITGSAFLAFLWARGRYGPGAHSTTIAFNSITIAELLHAFSSRSRYHSLFQKGWRERNRYLEGAVGGTLLAQGLVNLIPGMRRLLGMTPLGAADVVVTLGSAAAPLLVNESLKLLRERQPPTGSDKHGP